MKKLRYPYLFAFGFGLFLILFNVYVILDTLVISEVYVKADDNTTVDNEAGNTMDPIITSVRYEDENISIEIETYREYDTDIYVADIILTRVEYLKTAFAKSSYGKNITEKTSVIAQNNGAILAINGDYYGVQEKGFVLRNGVIYRESVSSNQEDLVIYDDGSFGIFYESDIRLVDLLAAGAYQVFSFGPALIDNYQVRVDQDMEVGKAMASNPRTAIGIIDELHYVFVVTDGRTEDSVGLSLYQLAHFMKSLDVFIAYNLDGGGSSAMYFNGKVINHPTTNGKKISERSVSDIVYVGY